MENKFNTIDEILEDIKAGKIVVMIDDEERENDENYLTLMYKNLEELTKEVYKKS